MSDTVVLAQLGTPDAPTPEAVRRYLGEFLADPRVVDLPRWFWLPLLRGVILRRRPAPVAALYESIWTEAGSPLLVHSQALAEAAQAQLNLPVRLGMRYGQPSLRDVLTELNASGSRVILVPLFPQYAEATTGSIVALARSLVTATDQLCVVDPLVDDASYIVALASTVREAQTADAVEHWVVSFHGLPMRQVQRGDPYPVHCRSTAVALAAAMNWSPSEWTLAYQSRFGPGAWLEPDTASVLKQLGQRGVSRVGVVTPGFAADCLETLEEIAVRGQEQFREAGGQTLTAVPCLNAHPRWVDAIVAAIGRARGDLSGRGVAGPGERNPLA